LAGDGPEARRIHAFYADLTTRLGTPPDDIRSVVVAHTLPDSQAFLWAIDSFAPISLLLPKPKSAVSESGSKVLKELGYVREDLSRDLVSDPAKAIILIDKKVPDGRPFVINDIGAYFAPALESLHDYYGPRLLGVLEGTENGALEWERTYRSLGVSPSVPILTVARSPLKLPEDYLVGMGIVFSIEHALREQVQVLQTRTACVIGFGRIGRGIADALRTRGVATAVYDIDPIARAEAAVRGFPVYEEVDDAIAFGSLVVSATGHQVINEETLYAMRSGTVVASVTSRDTEFDEPYLDNHYTGERIDKSQMWRYDEVGSDKYLWVVNDGNAPNFVHGAVLGPALHLISGEKVAGLHTLATRSVSLEGMSATYPLIELDREIQKLVATTWNDHFIANR
jgi:adenosylhomocysteinase